MRLVLLGGDEAPDFQLLFSFIRSSFASYLLYRYGRTRCVKSAAGDVIGYIRAWNGAWS